MAEQNERELYDLCVSYWDYHHEEDFQAMAIECCRIIQWFHDHKNDSARIQAAALNTDEWGWTGLHHLVVCTNHFMSFFMVKTWLTFAPETAQIKSFPDDHLPLHFACLRGASLEVVMDLVKAFPKGVEEKNESGYLPFHLVCIGAYNMKENPSVQNLSFLLKAYPESIEDEENRNRASDLLQSWPKRMSGNFSDDDEYSYYHEIENKLITSIFKEAIIGGHYLAVKLFVIAFPEQVPMPDNYGMVALHHACSNIASIDIAMILLDAAPESATIKDKWGRTPLQLLIPWETVQDENGMLPLHFQAAHSKTLTLSFLKLLIAAYPNSIHVRDGRGMLAFQYAFINKSLSIDVLMYFVQMNIDYLQGEYAS